MKMKKGKRVHKIQNVVLDTETKLYDETQGVDFFRDDLVELSIIPLTDSLDIDVVSPRLSVLVKPFILSGVESNDTRLPSNGITYGELREYGMNSDDLRSFIEGWMDALGIEQFIPLAHNWSFDRSFLAKTMGCQAVEKMFNRRARDSHSLAVSINDKAVLSGKEPPFESTSLGFLANYFGIDTAGAHRAEKDCIMTALAYKKLLQFEV